MISIYVLDETIHIETANTLLIFLFFSESSLGDSKESQTIQSIVKRKNSENRKKESLLLTIDDQRTSASPSTSGEKTDYSYNKKGQLLVNGYPYVRTSIKGALNTSIVWRCAETKKFKCRARVKTLGRELQIIDIQHNHEARKEKQFNAIIWNEK